MQWNEMQKILVLQAKTLCLMSNVNFESEIKEDLRLEWLEYVQKCRNEKKFTKLCTLLVLLFVVFVKKGKVILLSDIRRLVCLGRIPYLNVYLMLPEELKSSFSEQKFKARVFPSMAILSSDLAQFKLGLSSFSHDSNILYVDTVIWKIIQMLDLNYFTLYKCIKGTISQIEIDRFLRDSCFFSHLAAVIVFNIKLLFGLTDSCMNKSITIEDEKSLPLHEIVDGWNLSIEKYCDYQNYNRNWDKVKIQKYLSFFQNTMISCILDRCYKAENVVEEQEEKLDLSVTPPDFYKVKRISKINFKKYHLYTPVNGEYNFHYPYSILLDLLSTYLCIEKLALHKSVIRIERHIQNKV